MCNVPVKALTYVEKELLLLAFFSLFLEEDIARRIDNENLAVFSDNALLGTLRARGQRCFDRRRDTRLARLLRDNSLLVLAVLLLHGALLTTVHRGHLLSSFVRIIPLFSVDRRRGGDRVDAGNALDASVVTPSSPAGMPNIALDKLPATLVGHEQSEVVHATTHDDEHANHHGAKSRAVTLVVVARAPPLGKAVLQEVVVTLTVLTLQNIGNHGQPLVRSRGLLHVSINLPLRCLLDDLLALLLVLQDALGLETLAGFVGMQLARLLTVGLGQLILRGRGLHAEQIVESDIFAAVQSDFIAQAEYLVVCSRVLANGLW